MMTEKTALRLSIILSFFMIIYTAALFTSCSAEQAEQKKPETLAEEIVANIYDTTQHWIKFKEPLSEIDSVHEYQGLMLLYRNSFIENKRCNIKIEVPYSESEYDVITMIQPDTFVFNVEETNAILKAYRETYLIPEIQRINDSCTRARSTKEKSIIKQLCRK